ncbi:urease accessory protein UreF [Gloeothece verrucosa]|uniref:Urease accessory protein UreF n=1 Tax=Gloeothece verrucosa (strain PCC 7822) TaxID=497965 RepID=E0UK29_GLOV7|nr:urease accessory UreF family protein [Gloeothece verrucosa]ADN14665.1 Urease accessory protein UreF [Gloeothece verrucosa PCC 7822]
MNNFSLSQLFVLMQLSDSFFPSGSFTLSHGLEALVQEGQLHSWEDVLVFLRLLLLNKIATADVVALIHAYRGSAKDDLDAVRAADAQLFAQTLIEKTREMGRKSGRALLMVACQTWPDSQLETLEIEATNGKIYALHPVIFAVVGRVAGLSEENTVLAFSHSFVTGLLGAAIRLNVVGHLQAQKILRQLAPDLAAIYPIAAQLNLDQMWSCTPAIDLAQMRHKKLAYRSFAS